MFNGCRFSTPTKDELAAPLSSISKDVHDGTSEETAECSKAMSIRLTEDELAVPNLSTP